jgi:hypothetical protein
MTSDGLGGIKELESIITLAWEESRMPLRIRGSDRALQNMARVVLSVGLMRYDEDSKPILCSYLNKYTGQPIPVETDAAEKSDWLAFDVEGP